MERGKAIVLIGFMGAGKSTVGRVLARLTSWPLYDTDELVAAGFGLSISEIFATHGESAFRDAESRVLAELPIEQAIVATGGGAVLRSGNAEALRRLGTVFYLEAEVSTLRARISEEPQSRPLLKFGAEADALSRLLAERVPLYRAAADFTVPTDSLSAAEVADQILRHVG